MSSFSDRVRFNRDHRWAPPHMSDYLDGDLASAARARMERHVGECDECRRLLAGLRRTLDALRGLAAPAAGPGAVAIAAAVRELLTDRYPRD
jgi:anti-sigma factor RsiW